MVMLQVKRTKTDKRQTLMNTQSPVPRLILSDLDSAFKQLDSCFDQALSQASAQSATYSPVDVQTAIIFDLTILSQVSNACKPVLGVSSAMKLSQNQTDMVDQAQGSSSYSLEVERRGTIVFPICPDLPCKSIPLITYVTSAAIVLVQPDSILRVTTRHNLCPKTVLSSVRSGPQHPPCSLSSSLVSPPCLLPWSQSTLPSITLSFMHSFRTAGGTCVHS